MQMSRQGKVFDPYLRAVRAHHVIAPMTGKTCGNVQNHIVSAHIVVVVV